MRAPATAGAASTTAEPVTSWKQRWWATARASRGHLAWILLWSAIALIATVASPGLLGHPVFLMAMAPRALFVALAAPELDLASFVLLGTIRLSVTDPSYFLIGRRIAERGPLPGQAPTRFGVFGRLVKMMCRNRPLAAVVLFLRPNARYLGVAGAHQIPPTLAFVAATLGTICYLVAIDTGISLMF